MEPRNLGLLEADETGRWVWPFARLKPGDWFTMREDDKAIGVVRNYAHSAATRYGYRISVRKEDLGMIRVMRLGDLRGDALVRRDYGQLYSAIGRTYEFITDRIAWSEMRVGPNRIELQAVKEPLGAPIFVTVAGTPFVVELKSDHIMAERLPDGATYEDGLKLLRERREAVNVLE